MYNARRQLHCLQHESNALLYNTIDAVLARGEKLDDLIDKSDTLSMQSKKFYKTAKKHNQCCVVM